jgi:hypothetical protein
MIKMCGAECVSAMDLQFTKLEKIKNEDLRKTDAGVLVFASPTQF